MIWTRFSISFVYWINTLGRMGKKRGKGGKKKRKKERKERKKEREKMAQNEHRAASNLVRVQKLQPTGNFRQQQQ